jgi:hypothetical protein
LGKSERAILTEYSEAKMKRFFAPLAVAAALAAIPQGASAGTVASLQDWCFNVNGVNVTTNACNQSPQAPLPANVNGTNFDFTLGSTDPNYPTTSASNNLGSVAVTLGAGVSQYVLAYMDYDLNYNSSGSYQDYGTPVGAPGAGVTWELDDPNASNIFNDFAGNNLQNTNNVGTYSGPNTPCCDVSWALGAGGLNVTSSAIVTFTVSTTAPASGFYLQQTNGQDTSQNIYLSESVQYNQSATPEPATMALFAIGLAGVLLARKRIAA